MRKIISLSIVLALVVTAVLSACSAQETTPPSTPFSEPAIQPRADARLDADQARPYLAQVSFTLPQTKYVDLVDKAIGLHADEKARLARQGFVVSDRLTWQRFIEAYAWIYWKDLPVLVTTDSLFQTVHQSYDDLLKNLELAILSPQMNILLGGTQQQVRSAQAANQNQALAPLYADVDTYLAVALALLNQQPGNSNDAKAYVDLAVGANSVTDVELFGNKRTIDFTLFKPRGHYAEDARLQGYFRALSWLAQIDFRFVEFDMRTSQPILNQPSIAAAVILRNALDAAEQRTLWSQINQLFEVLVGRSDNMILPDFDRFLRDAQLADPAAILQADQAKLLTQLTTNDYGQQRITGQIIYRHIANTSPQPIPRPVSFLLLGQRFSIDAYVMGQLVYDRLQKDGKPVERALPAPLDVMYALGNDRAATHLTTELATYHYAGDLAALRQRVDALDPAFWQAPIYNEWLGMIRALNPPTTDKPYPQAMRTEAWADKILQTQLAAWAQLRHDNLLYVKQSFSTVQVTCSYPAGYVEPYPAFYGALHDYAQRSHAALTQVDVSHLAESATTVQRNALQYFERVMAIAERLRTLAEKELRLENFTPEEEAFLKSIMVQQKGADFAGCGGPRFEDQWDGWYANLFYGKDENPAIIADVHTNPTNDPTSKLYPPRVLHVASGPVAPLFFIVDTDEGPALYVGPAFSYFEVVTTGSETEPPARLTDEEWRQRLQDNPYPTAPLWTSSFRLPAPQPPQSLALPANIDAPEPIVPQPAPFSPLPTPTP
ncbi:MAG: DUF3160 domain-containing protein [Caldilineaceae bacterium]